MIKIDIQKALSLIKEPNPINIAEELIKRFNSLTVDNIERLYSTLYYSSKIDLRKEERNQVNMVRTGIRHLSKQSTKLFKELENRFIKDNLI